MHLSDITIRNAKHNPDKSLNLPLKKGRLLSYIKMAASIFDWITDLMEREKHSSWVFIQKPV